MRKILANDGMEDAGIKLLEKAGFIVVTDKVPQDELAEVINENDLWPSRYAVLHR